LNILVSFCNTVDTPGYPNLGLLNTVTKDFSIIDLPEEIPQTGMLGLAVSDKYLFVGLQHSEGGDGAYQSPPALLIVDRKKFTLVGTYLFHLVKDVHSFLLDEEASLLYVVSTGTDEIIVLTLGGSNVIDEKVFWRPEPDGQRKDIHHLNSIYKWHGELYVSGFGKKEIEDDWGSAHDGFIMNITTGKKIVSGLEQPHSIAVINNEMAFCESRTKKLRFLNREESLELPGYTRGLCELNGKAYVGTSASRKKSKSTGRALVISEENVTGCTISSILLDKLQLEYTWDLNDYGIEIYEFMIIDETNQWPLLPPRNYREQYISSWIGRAQQTLSEIEENIPAGENLLLVDESLLQINDRLLKNHCWFPFLEKDGVYWGAPPDDQTAIQELERMRNGGASYIAFAWPAFWWFEHYKVFWNYLQSTHKLIYESGNVVIYRFG